MQHYALVKTILTLRGEKSYIIHGNRMCEAQCLAAHQRKKSWAVETETYFCDLSSVWYHDRAKEEVAWKQQRNLMSSRLHLAAWIALCRSAEITALRHGCGDFQVQPAFKIGCKRTDENFLLLSTAKNMYGDTWEEWVRMWNSGVISIQVSLILQDFSVITFHDVQDCDCLLIINKNKQFQVLPVCALTQVWI